MALWRSDDPGSGPGMFSLYVENVEPDTWITAEMVHDIVGAQEEFRLLGLEPAFEIEWRAGAMLSLTIRAENGTWTWAFHEYDRQRNLYNLVWPD
jgi:hypothetical protein